MQQDKTSSNALCIQKRIEENENDLKETKIKLADVAFRMNHIRDKSVSQVFTNVATVTQDATNAVVNVSSDLANKTVAATKSVGSTIGSGVSSAVTATANASSALGSSVSSGVNSAVTATANASSALGSSVSSTATFTQRAASASESVDRGLEQNAAEEKRVAEEEAIKKAEEEYAERKAALEK